MRLPWVRRNTDQEEALPTLGLQPAQSPANRKTVPGGQPGAIARTPASWRCRDLTQPATKSHSNSHHEADARHFGRVIGGK